MPRYQKTLPTLSSQRARDRGTKLKKTVTRFRHTRSLSFESLEDRRLLAITVDTLVDELDGSLVDGDISLRDAIAAATSGETIDFSVAGVLDLTLGELTIDKDLVIDGPGSAQLTLDAGAANRIFNVDDHNAATNLDVEIRGLTLANGSVTGAGGGILSQETLTLVDAIFASNHASMDGGGLYATGMTSLSGSTFTGNSAGNQGAGVWTNGPTTVADSLFSMNTSFHDGGGIFTIGETTVTNTTFSDNTSTGFSGAGLFTLGTSIAVVDCTFTNNSSHRDGGGLFAFGLTTEISGTSFTGNSAATINGGGVWALGITTITDSTFTDNSAVDGGGLYARDITTISGSVFSGNSASDDGGGIVNLETMAITESTVILNSADDGGGGIWNSGAMTITGSTISRNIAQVNGGGINTSDTTTITNSTIYLNRASHNGGGVYLFSGTGTVAHSTVTRNQSDSDRDGAGAGGGLFLRNGLLSLDHTIVADNRDETNVGPDLTGFFGATLDSRFSLIGENQGSGLAEAPVGTPDNDGNLIGGPISGIIKPLLGGLADNGGQTQTLALLVGSPALDAGDPNAVAGVGSVPLVDQRGEPFSRVSNGNGLAASRIDIGAFEAPDLAESADFDQDGDVDGADFLNWQRGFGIVAPNASKMEGDADNDLDVDATDLGFWEQQYNFIEPTAPQAATESEHAASATPRVTPSSTSGPSASTDSLDAAIAIAFAELASERLEVADNLEDFVLTDSPDLVVVESNDDRSRLDRSPLDETTTSDISDSREHEGEGGHVTDLDEVLATIFS